MHPRNHDDARPAPHRDAHAWFDARDDAPDDDDFHDPLLRAIASAPSMTRSPSLSAALARHRLRLERDAVHVVVDPLAPGPRTGAVVVAVLTASSAIAAAAAASFTGDPSWDAVGNLALGLVIVGIGGLLAMQSRSMLGPVRRNSAGIEPHREAPRRDLALGRVHRTGRLEDPVARKRRIREHRE